MTAPAREPENVILDASAMVDLLARTERFGGIRTRLAGTVMHAPAHFDVEVLSALGRLQRSAALTAEQVGDALEELQRAPVNRHPLLPLLAGAWARRDAFRLTDALYVELADATGLVLVTTDYRLARAFSGAEAIE